jgi:RimJ/RimL family protein N-acetyltransferase
VRAVIRWAQEVHAITRLVLITHADNAASQRVAERAGFIRVEPMTPDPPFRDGRTESILFEFERPAEGRGALS